jgi:hypothetical protein
MNGKTNKYLNLYKNIFFLGVLRTSQVLKKIAVRKCGFFYNSLLVNSLSLCLDK